MLIILIEFPTVLSVSDKKFSLALLEAKSNEF